MINKETTIEELVDMLPESVSYLMDKGIRALICGEPIWGTLEEIVISKGYSINELEAIINDLNLMYSKTQSSKP